jgi:hypothetical protein
MIRKAAKYSVAVAYLLASSSLAFAAPTTLLNCRIAKPGTLEYRLCKPTESIPDAGHGGSR